MFRSTQQATAQAPRELHCLLLATVRVFTHIHTSFLVYGQPVLGKKESSGKRLRVKHGWYPRIQTVKRKVFPDETMGDSSYLSYIFTIP